MIDKIDDKVSSTDAAAWFAKAAPKRLPSGVRVPNKDDPKVVELAGYVKIVARNDPSTLTLELRDSFDRAMKKRARLQTLLVEVQPWLAEVADILPEAITDPLRLLAGDTETKILISLSEAVEPLTRAVDAAIPVLGAPGRAKSVPWRVVAYSLAELAKAAWEAAGWQGLSDRTDGPVLRVVVRALRAATGEDVPVSSVVSAMKARPAMPPMTAPVPRS
jgi:hypothetical protein